jgi:hypothetical protein
MEEFNRAIRQYQETKSHNDAIDSWSREKETNMASSIKSLIIFALLNEDPDAAKMVALAREAGLRV